MQQSRRIEKSDREGGRQASKDFSSDRACAASNGKTTVAIKIIDMLGEEVMVTKEHAD